MAGPDVPVRHRRGGSRRASVVAVASAVTVSALLLVPPGLGRATAPTATPIVLAPPYPLGDVFGYVYNTSNGCPGGFVDPSPPNLSAGGIATYATNVSATSCGTGAKDWAIAGGAMGLEYGGVTVPTSGLYDLSARWMVRFHANGSLRATAAGPVLPNGNPALKLWVGVWITSYLWQGAWQATCPTVTVLHREWTRNATFTFVVARGVNDTCSGIGLKAGTQYNVDSWIIVSFGVIERPKDPRGEFGTVDFAMGAGAGGGSRLRSVSLY